MTLSFEWILSAIAFSLVLASIFIAAWLQRRKMNASFDQFERQVDERFADFEQCCDQALTSLECRLDSVEQSFDSRLDSLELKTSIGSEFPSNVDASRRFTWRPPSPHSLSSLN